MPGDGKLTLGDLTQLGALAEAVQRGAKVAWLNELVSDPIVGTLRHFCRDESGAFLQRRDDVRDGLVRITTTTGFESFKSVREVCGQLADGTFVLDYEEVAHA